MEIEQLITSVKNRPSIWDKRQTDHHNRYVLDRLWKEVSEENMCTVKDAQSKWKSLRDYYRKELQKTQLHQAAEGVGCNYICSWPYFKLLDFLNHQFTLKRSSSVVKIKKMLTDSEATEGSTEEAVEEFNWTLTSQNDSLQEVSAIVTVDGVQSLQVNSEANDTYSPDIVAHEIVYPEHSTSPDAFILPDTFQKKAMKNKNNQPQSLIDMQKRKVSTLEEKMTKSKEDITCDEDQSFFASLLPHVRNIKGVNKILFRNEVQNLIVKYAYPGSATPRTASKSSRSTDSNLHSYSAAMHPQAF